MDKKLTQTFYIAKEDLDLIEELAEEQLSNRSHALRKIIDFYRKNKPNPVAQEDYAIKSPIQH